MADDIVTRLRHGEDYDGTLMGEAADKIERLRAEVIGWRKVAQHEHAAWSQCPAECLCLSNEFRKAVRNES